MRHYFRCILMFFLTMMISSVVVADKIVSPVPFLPDQVLYLVKNKKPFHKRVNYHIQNDLKAGGYKIFIGKPVRKSDYALYGDHAVACSNLGYSDACYVMVIWDLLRSDNSPVASWEAFYPLKIPLKHHTNHFVNYRIPDKVIAEIGDDFLKSLNYETLKNERLDRVYIKPDTLSDQTTLCTRDSLNAFYQQAGLFTAETPYKARFLIQTYVAPETLSGGDVALNVKRSILDRLTGQFDVFTMASSVTQDFLALNAYDCDQSAAITMQKIGLFIDQAP